MTQADTQEDYQVVARKYRPQSFQGLIGQSHISTALSNAIKQNRIGHAYLFTGARGVGKTSSARIFAKCLNCVNGPTIEPCNQCNLCQAISIGEDIDCLEIDGASNRGIDEIRQLRSNVSIRPSRGRFKIYIIDEVHMLTSPAFNALLKTLEEPPPHVKFIFCTTDPHKIPITVLSRCQRFDFSPVQTAEIARSLENIAAAEGIETDSDAVILLARRANGSMRDSQSLLEQLFSFCDGRITVDLVNQLLGTADTGRIAQLAAALIEGRSSQAIVLINQSVLEGVDAGQFARQLLGYFRDLMAIKIGCDRDALLSCSPSEIEELQAFGQKIGLETILSIMQLIDSAIVKMQHSLHTRTLLEMAAIRICSLENLDSLADLVNEIASGDLSPPVVIRQGEASTDSVDSATTNQSAAAARGKNSAQTDSSKKKIGESVATSDSGLVQVDSEQVNSEVECKGDLLADLIDQTNPGPSADRDAHSPHVVFAKSANQTAFIGDQAAGINHQGVGSPLQVSAAGSTMGVTKKTEPPHEMATLNSTSMAKSAASDIETGNLLIGEPLALLKAGWQQMVDELAGLTAEMLADYESLVWASENRVSAVLKDDYKMQECSKPEKKKRAENLLSAAIGRTIKIDLSVSHKQVNRSREVAPRLSRAQELRMLQGDEYVQHAMTVLDAEIVNFYRPQARSK